jgi:hypothetical protein
MLKADKALTAILLTVGMLGCVCGPAAAAIRIEGQVQAGGGPITNSMVTLWGASAGEPRQLAQTKTSSDGRFELGSQETLGADVILYVVAKGGEAAVNKGNGDNPAIAMLSVLGNAPAPKVVINEMTTVASVWTHSQFLDGTVIKGHLLGLKIAAGNMPRSANCRRVGASLQYGVAAVPAGRDCRPQYQHEEKQHDLEQQQLPIARVEQCPRIAGKRPGVEQAADQQCPDGRDTQRRESTRSGRDSKRQRSLGIPQANPQEQPNGQQPAKPGRASHQMQNIWVLAADGPRRKWHSRTPSPTGRSAAIPEGRTACRSWRLLLHYQLHPGDGRARVQRAGSGFP